MLSREGWTFVASGSVERDHCEDRGGREVMLVLGGVFVHGSIELEGFCKCLRGQEYIKVH